MTSTQTCANIIKNIKIAGSLNMYTPVLLDLVHFVIFSDQTEWSGDHLSTTALVSCSSLSIKDGEPMHFSRFADACWSWASIHNEDTKCEHHCLHQASDLIQDIETIDRTKKGTLHKHLATNALCFGCECFCLKSSKRFWQLIHNYKFQ